MRVNRLSFSWQQYKYRFVPWLAYSWRKNRNTVRRIKKSEDTDPEKEFQIINALRDLFQELYNNSENNDQSSQVILKEKFGFIIERKKSNIKDAGHGVFVTNGDIPEHHIAAMYPGTVYFPSDPLLFQSIGNPFILRCIDGLMIDGSDRGISKLIFRSCSGRDMIGPYRPCDTTWLTDSHNNPLAIGQYVNNHTSSQPANVVYQELDISSSFPLHLLQYMPNIAYQNQSLEREIVDEGLHFRMRVVVLMSLRQIMKDEELLSAYFTEVY